MREQDRGWARVAMTAAVTEELSRLPPTRVCCRRAEVATLLRFAATLHTTGGPHSVPASQRASDGSLLRRLRQANERNRLLAEENQRLRRQLEHALGEQRAARDGLRPAAAPTPAIAIR